ncbi:hypothetical protein SERLA73DRAFT_69112 [Serpula lacrymans var. lacrymans S7.3]|nr:uncharacterized protein SERLADRAFT_433017 [Serpula lacrymans var. lacrymans S7.9]EGO03208.1 hypothetical protein SERLA73DRAFT_69112 [Serpula lacrymans var. lacrymans S7.3]EGO29001.1 hypothetical protein SERLADRAFT_433017 [Serpula lacrymans var. lacrymans S7.9]
MFMRFCGGGISHMACSQLVLSKDIVDKASDKEEDVTADQPTTSGARSAEKRLAFDGVQVMEDKDEVDPEEEDMDINAVEMDFDDGEFDDNNKDKPDIFDNFDDL